MRSDYDDDFEPIERLPQDDVSIKSKHKITSKKSEEAKQKSEGSIDEEIPSDYDEDFE